MRRPLTTLLVLLATTLPAAPARPTDSLDRLVETARYWDARGRADRAADAWERVLLARPDDPRALSAVAILRARAGKTDEATKLLETLRKAAPGHESIAAVVHAIRVGGRYPTLVAEARGLAREQRFEDSVRKYREAFGEGPPSPELAREFWQTLGGTDAGWAPATRALQEIAAADPSDVEAAFALARHFTFRAPRRVEGIERLRKLTPHPQVGARARAALREALLWLEPARKEESLLEAWLASTPEDAEIRQRLNAARARRAHSGAIESVFAALDRGDVAAAERALQAMGSRTTPEILTARALVLLHHERHDEAGVVLEEARRLAPKQERLWAGPLATAKYWSDVRQGEAARAHGRPGEAKAVLERALAGRPDDNLHARIAYAAVLYDLAEDAAALDETRRAVADAPGDPLLVARLVDLLLRGGDSAGAKALNERLAAERPELARTQNRLAAEQHRQRAVVCRRHADRQCAREELEAALLLAPDGIWIIHDLADLSLEAGNLDEARRWLAALNEAAPKLPQSRLLHARLLASEGRSGEALQLLKALPEDSRTEPALALERRLELQFTVAEIVSRAAHSPGVAKRRMEVVEREAVGDPERAMVVAEGWKRMGRVDRAVQLLRATAPGVEQPEPPVALRIASFLLDSGDQEGFAETIDSLERRSLSPSDRRGLVDLKVASAVRDTDALREKGTFKPALHRIEPMLEQYPKDPRLLCALGRLLEATGSSSDAFDAYQRALQSDRRSRDALAGMVAVARDAGRVKETRAILDERRADAPDDSQLHLFSGRLALAADDEAAALQAFRDGLRVARSGTTEGSTAALLSRASARLSGEVDPATLDTRRQLRTELGELERHRRLEIAPGLDIRRRAGEPGLGQLTEAKLPVETSTRLGAGRIGFRFTPTALYAGALQWTDPSLHERVGTGGAVEVPVVGPDVAMGMALQLAYRLRGLELDIGSTPLGFEQGSVVGGISWRAQHGAISWALEASRRPVTDSLLSYGGMRDPTTDEVWGGVVRQGARLDFSWREQSSSWFVFADGRHITGHGVEDNQSILGGGGVEWRLGEFDGMRLSSGLTVVGMGFARNLSRFTLGHGGYFSPQAFVHVGVPFRWQHRGKARWELMAEPGVNWFHEAPALHHPGHPELQRARAEEVDGASDLFYPERTSLAFALNVRSRLTWPISDSVEIGGAFDLHTGEDYQEVIAGIVVIFGLSRGGE